VITAVCLLITVAASLRWLRVAQREHYLAGSATRFARRWWTSTPVNLAGAALAVVAASVAALGVLAIP
jgi:UDP-N-acetylmuramoyl-tripeptide--D-alanyl-D-alanine ligase